MVNEKWPHIVSSELEQYVPISMLIGRAKLTKQSGTWGSVHTKSYECRGPVIKWANFVEKQTSLEYDNID